MAEPLICQCFNTQPPEGGWPDIIKRRIICCKFQHTAARRRLGGVCTADDCLGLFQHTAARRRLGVCAPFPFQHTAFQHTAARRRLDTVAIELNLLVSVSTHSRPKAAGAFLKSLAPSGFAAPISLSSREKREREYNTAFSVTPAFAIS